MKKKVWKIIGMIVLVFILLAAAVLIYFTVREYRPKQEEILEVPRNGRKIGIHEPLTVLTYNIGYAGLNKTEDFFMDGGTKVQPKEKEEVEENLKGITDILKEHSADVYFFQEVDKDSKRSFHIDEQGYLEETLQMPSVMAYNFKCDFVPYPIPPIGKMQSGITTMTDIKVDSAKRISLPESFSWPVKTCNLKRCMLEMRIPLEGTDKELVLINFHLEAYDSGEGKIAQSKMLAEKLKTEYEKGNYVIAGGDFNQTFEGIEKYPVKNKEDWTPGTIGMKDIPEHFSFAVDDSYPTCRLLNQPYTGDYETSQVYVLDGFIVSDNLEVELVEVVDTNFEYTDHQPVKLKVRFL